jgi:gamma-glutamyl-gamma-aminobutyrate hydrolase PuuD
MKDNVRNKKTDSAILRIKKMGLSLSCLLLVSFTVFSAVSCANNQGSSQTKSATVGIAWRSDLDSEFYTNISRAITEAGGTPKLLGQALSTDVSYDSNNKIQDACVDENGILKIEYAKKIRENNYASSNVKDIIGQVDAIVFTGGEDISPTLYKIPEEWHGIEAEKDYNATRDVSDYLTMSYCVSQDIKLMGFCRGMQMLGVFSGATVIQDIPTYFKNLSLDYHYEHRNEKTGDNYRDYAPHDVEAVTDSKLYEITNETLIKNVPSWHHQSLLSVENTSLKVTGTTDTSGLKMIECIERTDKTYEVGFQFHPEAAIVKNLDNASNKDKYMDYGTAMKFFKALVSA